MASRFAVFASMWARLLLYLAGAAALAAAASDEAVDILADATTGSFSGLWDSYVKPMLPERPALSLLDRTDDKKYWITVALIVVGYMGMYIGPAALFELSNPKPKTAARLRSIRRELDMGVWAMLGNTSFAVLWMTFIEPHTPFYGFFEPSMGGREFTPLWFVGGLVAYLLAFDFHFTWTHYWLHTAWLFKHVHAHHHNFVNPTAFAQDAVHPFEGILQGPAGHYFCSLVFPMHPVAHAAFGFLTSIYAIAAHDGRAWDLADHTVHHHHKELNFGLFGCMDCLWGTRYRPGYNGTVRGIMLNRFLQFTDVYTRDDLARAMREHKGSDRLASVRAEVEECRARLGGSPAVLRDADAELDGMHDAGVASDQADVTPLMSEPRSSSAPRRRR